MMRDRIAAKAAQQSENVFTNSTRVDTVSYMHLDGSDDCADERNQAIQIVLGLSCLWWLFRSLFLHH